MGNGSCSLAQREQGLPWQPLPSRAGLSPFAIPLLVSGNREGGAVLSIPQLPEGRLAVPGTRCGRLPAPLGKLCLEGKGETCGFNHLGRSSQQPESTLRARPCLLFLARAR